MSGIFSSSRGRAATLACCAMTLLGGCAGNPYNSDGLLPGQLREERRFGFSGAHFAIENPASRDDLLAPIIDHLNRAGFKVDSVVYKYDGFVQTVPEKGSRQNNLIEVDFHRELPDFARDATKTRSIPGRVHLKLNVGNNNIHGEGAMDLTADFFTRSLQRVDPDADTRTFERVFSETTEKANTAILSALPDGKQLSVPFSMKCIVP